MVDRSEANTHRNEVLSTVRNLRASACKLNRGHMEQSRLSSPPYSKWQELLIRRSSCNLGTSFIAATWSQSALLTFDSCEHLFSELGNHSPQESIDQAETYRGSLSGVFSVFNP